MNEPDNAQDLQHQLEQLENRITDLLTMLERLMQENHQLKAERIHFLKKNKRIQTQVEGMIHRLKAMENDHCK